MCTEREAQNWCGKRSTKRRQLPTMLDFTERMSSFNQKVFTNRWTRLIFQRPKPRFFAASWFSVPLIYPVHCSHPCHSISSIHLEAWDYCSRWCKDQCTCWHTEKKTADWCWLYHVTMYIRFSFRGITVKSRSVGDLISQMWASDFDTCWQWCFKWTFNILKVKSLKPPVFYVIQMDWNGGLFVYEPPDCPGVPR